jgi:uncharacterized membrane protein YqjE
MSEGSGKLVRVTKAVGSLMQVHVEVAKREAAQDRARITGGVVLLTLALAVLVGFILLGHVAAQFALMDLGFRGSVAALMLMGFDLVAILVCVLMGRSRLSKRVLPQTRELLHNTWDTVMGAINER